MSKTLTVKDYTNYRIVNQISEGGLIEFFGNDKMTVSDGYHTMDELYEHRVRLWINLCYTYFCLAKMSANKKDVRVLPVWRSGKHSNGDSIEGYFVLGIGVEQGEQITYHLSNEYWRECDFAETFERAPEFDGHTSNDVLERLKIV